LGEVLPLLLAAIISMIAIFVISTRLEESNPCIVDTKLVSLKNIRRFFQVEHKDCYTEGEMESDAQETRSWRSIIRISGIPLLYSIYFLTFFSFSLFYAGLPIYASNILEWSAQELGLFLAYSSFLMIIVQGPGLNFLSRFLTNLQLVLIGSILLAVSFYMLQIQDFFVLYGANTLLSIGNGLMWPSFLAMLSATGSRSSQGSIQGYGTSMGSIASMLGLVIGGVLFENIETGVFVMASGLMVVISLIVIVRYFRRRRKGAFAKA
jgi:predicted MFS family arabinose efflux permease